MTSLLPDRVSIVTDTAENSQSVGIAAVDDCRTVGRHMIPVLPRNGTLPLPGALRIAHFVDEFDPDGASGVQRSVSALSRTQAEQGQYVARFTVQWTGTGAGHRVADCRSSGRRMLNLAAGAVRLAGGRSIPPALLSELKAWKPDIVHFHSLYVPENVALAKFLRESGIPYCVSVHGALAGPPRRQRQLKKLLFHALYERAYLNSASLIHALTSEERETIRAYRVRSPIAVAPNGVDVDALPTETNRRTLLERFPSVQDRRVFMFLGRLDPVQKGLDQLLHAFSAAQLDRAVLILIGPDWRGARTGLEATARRLGVSDRTIFAGPVFGAVKTELLSGTDVFVHPSRWEGVSISVLEAMALQRACLLTDAADPAGVLVKSGAAVVVGETHDSLICGLRTMYAMSAHELREMGSRARSIAQTNFSWVVVARTLIDAYYSQVAR
jgi:glycosyltransferase involved in cell wall biosynthesis